MKLEISIMAHCLLLVNYFFYFSSLFPTKGCKNNFPAFEGQIYSTKIGDYIALLELNETNLGFVDFYSF